MVDEKLVKVSSQIEPYSYHLKSHKKAYSPQTYRHELIGAEIYTSFFKYLDFWAVYFEDEEFESVGLRYDRVSIFYSDFGGARIFWELDRSFMTQGKIRSKLEKYVRFAKRHERKFTVVLACSSRRAKSLARILADFKNSYVKFYTVDYRELCTNPTGEIFNSPTLNRVTLLSYPKEDFSLEPTRD